MSPFAISIFQFPLLVSTLSCLPRHLHHLKARCTVPFPQGMKSFSNGERCVNWAMSNGQMTLADFSPRCREWTQILCFGILTLSSLLLLDRITIRRMRMCQPAKTGGWEVCSVECFNTLQRDGRDQSSGLFPSLWSSGVLGEGAQETDLGSAPESQNYRCY